MPIPQLHPSRHYGRLPESAPAPRKEKRDYNRKKLLKNLGWTALIGTIGIFIIGTITVAWVSRDLPDPDKINSRQVSQSTKIYDRTGANMLYEIYQNQKRTLVNLDQIATSTLKATIAVEDKNFYEHGGIQIKSIIRATFNNLIGRKTGSGGASTLTQQLIKNAVVGNEHSVFRKLKEAILAIRLEKKYSKDQILKLYLNEIPYGSTNYGIEAASQSYFHKSAKDLTLAESATLASIPKAPSTYLKDLDALRNRRDLVLSLMYDQGYITEQEKKDAQGIALRIFRSGGPMDAPHFVLYVKQLLADKFGERAIDEGGLQVITTLDYDKQKIAEKTVKELGDKNAKNANANNAALVALDPKTAQILALVGSRDYFNDEINGQFDVATLGKRQPGSSFKPFVYTAAFEKGYTPDTVLYDVSTNFDARAGQDYTPKNYDGKDHGLVTMRKALQGSLNIPAVKTLYLVGSANAIDFAKRFGYTTLTGDYGLSLVLGGAEVNLLEHTNGYATLANNGVYNEPVSILKVTNNLGEVLYQWKPSQGQEAITPEIAATTADVLSDDPARAFVFSLHGNLTLPDRPVAAKTGTTNDNKDAWTMGYVPSLAAGVWVGNTIPTPMKAGGNALAGTIWNRFMREALKGSPVETFPTPPINDAQKSVLRGGNGGITLNINSETGKIANSTTPENLIVQRAYLPPHDILHYVIKDDPRGPAPAFPADDPQYEAWEAGLQSWIAREQTDSRNLTFQEPPNEYDNVQTSELAPTLEFISPTEGQILTSREINIQVKASAPQGVTKVMYQIDGHTIGQSIEFPFNFTYYAQTLLKGPHNLSAVATDGSGNSTQKNINFALQADFDPANFEWFDKDPLIIKTNEFPRIISLTPFRWDDTKQIDIFISSATTPSKLLYNFNHTEDQLVNNQLTFTWKHAPAVGGYVLKAILLENTGKKVEKVLNITIE
ncbi:MAG: Penicillin-binding protein, 1A family [Candidatus Magasanikbacteria bacterium GW2011_GWA2_40_10]|uniref:Penicillin-binding protein, 1A family n=1 Tax=Candidatus Magasanikbacteria bacterium GW2011_GWA2_40_10 TaxID=1619037 RepID=A0A0G0TAD7_9BACT|nr:MAG: Penicillin-binding protein, 1A family [Candidatus Magasanikbacteria bacterium GW2011_GWA2_40_10]